jgi:LAGLIDADG endonuclease
VEVQFKIGLHQKDIAILEQIQSYFGVGKIYKSKNSNSILYNVFSKKDLLVLINHFDKYPLLTQKRADYEL